LKSINQPETLLACIYETEEGRLAKDFGAVVSQGWVLEFYLFAKKS
jgi:hypothetical protein